MLTAGPFEMAPGDTQTVAFAVEIGQGVDPLDSITRLRSIASQAPSLFRALVSNQPGACCGTGGGCQVTLESDCAGTFFPGSSCAADPCAVREGACCLRNGLCIITPDADCPGAYQGNGAACAPNPCPPPQVGACCIDYQCFLTPAQDCAGSFQGIGTDCAPGMCSAISWRWSPEPRWLDGVNTDLSAFFGGIGLGSEFFGSNLPREEVDNARIRFVSEELGWSRCATYRRDLGYQFGGIGTFPGSAWDLSDPQHPRRVNICYTEWSTPEKPANLMWDPDDSSLGGREYFFIMKSDYDGGLPYGHGMEDLYSDVMWTGWTRVRTGHQLLETTPATLTLLLGTAQDPYGACCMPDGDCLVQLRSECTGAFAGDGTACDPFPCVPAAVGPVASFALPGLAAPSPNPTSRSAVINFELARSDEASIRVFTVQGALVRTLTRGPQAEGHHQLVWDLRDEQGHLVPQGAYYARLSTPQAEASRIIVVVR